MGEMLPRPGWRRRGIAWPLDARVFPDQKRCFPRRKSVECLGFQTRRSKNSREMSAWAFFLEKMLGNMWVFRVPNWSLGWWQCGRQRGREEAAAARARARGGRRAMALAPGESGRYRLALARAGAPARARGGREGGEREARHWWGESDVARSDWSTCRDLIGPHVLAVATSRF
jgi:hypothetical protein